MLQKKSIFFGLEKYSDRTAIFDQNEKKYSYKKLLKDSKLFNRFFLEKILKSESVMLRHYLVEKIVCSGRVSAVKLNRLLS